MSRERKEIQALELKAQEVPLDQQDLQEKVVLAVLGHLALLDQGVPRATWEYLDLRVLLASLGTVTPPHALLMALEISSHTMITSTEVPILPLVSLARGLGYRWIQNWFTTTTKLLPLTMVTSFLPHLLPHLRLSSPLPTSLQTCGSDNTVTKCNKSQSVVESDFPVNLNGGL